MLRADYHAAGLGPSTAPLGDALDGERFLVLVPALDCAATISEVVAGAREHVRDVLVIDDGSSDDTHALALAAGAEVLRHRERRGKGCALQSGMAWAAERGFTHVFAVDGDGQHLAAEMPILLEASRMNPTAIVLGERSRDGHDISPMKLFGNRFANRWVEIASGRAFEDTQSGFRIYPVAATSALGGHARHYGWETEVLIRALRTGVPVVCRTVKVYYPPAELRVSYYRPWIDTIRIIFIVVGLILRLRR
ncbi:MAG: glycosyltransferase family 2 protein [Candidatus Binatia bacterium]